MDLSFLRDRVFLRDMLALAIPVAFQQFITASLSMIDVLMVGRLGETSVAALGLANQIFFLLILFLFGVPSGRVWKQRVTTRFSELPNKDVATWEQVQHQSGHFRKWEPDTALFIDAMNSVEQNYETVLKFITSETVVLKPMDNIPWVAGNYHG